MRLFPLAPIAKAITLALPLMMLTGCNDSDNSDSNSATVTPTSGPAVSFDPETGQIPYPNDILALSDTAKFKAPGTSTQEQDTAESFPNAYWNYLASQDGWGTAMPLEIQFEETGILTSKAVDLNEATLASGIKLFMDNQGKLEPLLWGEDFRATVVNKDRIHIEPLKPFEESTHYYLALTKNVKDMQGATIQSSKAYQDLRNDGSKMGNHLAQVFERLEQNGIASEQIVYAADFTTLQVMSTLDSIVDNYLEKNRPHFESTKELSDNQIKKIITSMGNDSPKMEIVKDIVNDLLKEAGFEPPEKTEAEINYRLLKTSLSLPYYLDTPVKNKNCTWHPSMDISPITGGQPSLTNTYRVAPQDQCPGAVSYWQDSDGTPISTGNADDLKKFKDEKLEALVVLPKEPAPGPEGYPTFIYIHGVTSQKESILNIANAIADKGYAVVAIDQPMHNSRGINKKSIINPKGLKINATGNVLDFVMPSNVLTTKGYMYQSLVDHLGLRMAVADGLIDPQNSESNLFDINNIHLMGVSLGGIVATSEVALLRDAWERHPEKRQQLEIKSASLSVPGGSIASIMLHSPALKGSVEKHMKDSAAFRLYLAEKLGGYKPLKDQSNDAKLKALDWLDSFERVIYETTTPTKPLETLIEVIKETNPSMEQPILSGLKILKGFKDKKEENTSSSAKTYEAFEKENWNLFADEGEYIIQSVMDPVDPINHAKVLKEHKDQPLFLMEVVGDGSNTISPAKAIGAIAKPELATWNPGDFVVPNTIENRPQGGTDALIRALELDIIDGSVSNSGTSLRAAARYQYGTHGSTLGYFDMSWLSAGLLPYDQDVHQSMMEGIFSFANSQGKSINLPSQAISDGSISLLKPIDSFPKQPD